MPHTPGRAHYAPDLSHHGHHLVYAADGQLLANTGSFRRTDEENVANAEHMTECWNACEGMQQPEKAITDAVDLVSIVASDLEASGMPEAAADLRNAVKLLRGKA